MQTLRKKNSPCKLKNEPTRFLGEGVSFKAKLIGILEVSEARGDRMCQAALADLKMAIRAAGEHKQRITVQISIDGLRLRDEKTGDCLYHHPVHKISFIAQDMSDSRAFGYIFGSPDTGHRFFGIKTDKAASQVVIAMRDLFQVVFELKKKEIELAKQHIEHSNVLFDNSGLFIERPPDTKGTAGSDSSLYQTASDSDKSRKHGPQSGVVADLLDLQFELNSLQQGIHQMDKITPDNPRPSDATFDSDPFGDSFTNIKISDHVQPILPPPPSSSKRGHFERQQSVLQTPNSGKSSPANLVKNSKTPPATQGPAQWFDKETDDLFKRAERSNSVRKNSSSDEDRETPSTGSYAHDGYKQMDVFSELDPLEPPPRGGSAGVLINPPPLPPKKQGRHPPRPPYGSNHFQYDFLERQEGSPSPTSKSIGSRSPKNIKDSFDDNFSPPLPQLPKKSDLRDSFSKPTFEDSFNSIIQSPRQLSNGSQRSSKSEKNATKTTKEITLSQLTSTYLTELADKLDMTVQEVTSLTLQQLTECIESLANKENSKESKSPNKSCDKISNSKPNNDNSYSATEPLFKATFDQDIKPMETSTGYDKYAVFRELLDMEGATNQLKAQKSKSSEEDDAVTSENQEESGDPEEDDAQSDEIEENLSLTNLTVKLPQDCSKDANEVSVYYQMKSSEELSESPKESTLLQEDAESEEQNEDKDSTEYILAEDKSRYEDKTPERNDLSGESFKKMEDSKESLEKLVPEDSSEHSRTLVQVSESKNISSSSCDRYAALREIIGETEETPLGNDIKNSNEVELQGLFSENISQPTTTANHNHKKDEDQKNVLDIFEEIKMLNTDAHRSKEKRSSSSNIESMFCPLVETKQDKEDNKDYDNWTKFDAFASEKVSSVPVGGSSPWSPDSKNVTLEPPSKVNVYRHSGESDNEWKDEEESEESNGRCRGEVITCKVRHPHFEAQFEERQFYEEPPIEEDKDRGYRDKVCRKVREVVPSWPKGSHRGRDRGTWHEDPRWEEERRRYMHRKMPYKNEEEEYKAWKFRMKQRQWNGEREGFWGPEHGFYEEDCKRRMPAWTEEDRERFSSQESMGYDEEERYYRREFERRRWEEENGKIYRGPEGEYSPRESFKKPDSRYYREPRARHYDYPPTWDEEYAPKHPEESTRYVSTRKKHWPKRPNSAADGRNMEMMYPAEIRPKCTAVSRSECSDNDSDPYHIGHRPYRSRSRESYNYGSDQEYENWGERSYYSEAPETKSEMTHRRRLNRHRSERIRPTIKLQSSPFEDDFTEPIERNEQALDTLNVDPRILSDIDPKQPSSPRSPRTPKDQCRRGEGKNYKSSSYFDDDLTPTASASSDTSDRQRLGSDLKITPEEISNDPRDPAVDSFASEDSGRDSFFNGDPRFDDDAFTFRSELEDQVPERTASFKNNRHSKYGHKKIKGDQYVKKSESVNIFRRENDPFDDDEFFN